jgi:ZIP family zinc transporter
MMMSLPQLFLLGAIAGYTIFLGLPIARLRNVSERWSVGAGAASAGVLLFLIVDIVNHMVEPIEEAATNLAQGAPNNLPVLSAAALAGMAAGFLGLMYLSSVLTRRSKGPAHPGDAAVAMLDDPVRLALTIAIGIGLHNFAEGLAIGQAAAAGALNLALILIIGFGLHNATEGFGITGPLVGHVRPSWRFLLLVGLIGGSPTFLGTLLGRVYSSTSVSTLFLALAAGSIIFVVQTLIHSGLRSGKSNVFSVGLLLGLVAGIATDLVIAAAGV